MGPRFGELLVLRTPTWVTPLCHEKERAVIRAIEKDKAEIVVMPGPGRVIKG
jgi:hypothetical protein